MRLPITSRSVAAAAFAAALAWVFWSQPHDDGFSRGHRGWVSAHTLAIAQKASPRNGLVGYAVSLATPASRDLFYFDRYPVFFSAALHGLQSRVAPDRAAEIRVARQAMNAVYALTLVVGAALLVQLGLPLEAAIAATALAGAGSTMVEYRDMVHFDQPALLGIVALLWAIARWYCGGGNRFVYAVTAFAVLSGRGYASFAVLGLWWIFDAPRLLSARAGAGPAEIVRRIVAAAPTRACVLGIAVAAACLSYNVAMEARVRDVALSEVGIVRSAMQRLSLDEGFNQRKARRLTWGHFLASQQGNFARSVLPWSRKDPVSQRRPLQAAIVAVVLAGAFAFAATRGSAPLRGVVLVACACGPLWLVAMRNLAAFHPYTAVYLFPACLMFFAAVVAALRAVLPRRLGVATALAACALLAMSNHARNREIEREGRGPRVDTRDMQQIARVLDRREAVATDRQLFPGVPFALGFYLPEHDILVEGPASVVLSRRPGFPGQNLTPGNVKIFAFRPDRTWNARSSLARLHPDSAAAGSRERRRTSRRGAPER